MSKKQKKRHDAVRIRITDTKLPQPTDELIEEMAQGTYIAVTSAAVLAMDSEISIEWKELHDEVRDMWCAGARSAYAVIAIHGGAKCEGIDAE